MTDILDLLAFLVRKNILTQWQAGYVTALLDYYEDIVPFKLGAFIVSNAQRKEKDKDE